MSSSLTSVLDGHREEVGVFTDEDIPSLREVLSTVIDPRCRRGVRYVFTEVLLVCAAAVLSGAKSLTMIFEWAVDAHRRGVIGSWKRTPSIPTLHRIAASTDPEALDAAIGNWVRRYRAHQSAADQKLGISPQLQAVAVDGKEVRGSKHAGGVKTFLMGALEHTTGVVLAQEAVDEKSNEIPHLPALLDKLGPLDGAVITADALHTLAQQATAITGRGGHYLFTVKTNAKRLHTQISQAGWAGRKPQYRHREKAHGRTSSWQATVMAAPGFIEFPQAAQIILIQRGRDEHRHSQVEATGEIVYAITSLPPAAANPKVLAQLLRGHWGIENRLHWVRDTAYDEDASQIRTGKAAHFMASMRNLSISAHRLAGEPNITAALRRYGRNPKLAAQLTGL